VVQYFIWVKAAPDLAVADVFVVLFYQGKEQVLMTLYFSHGLAYMMLFNLI